MLGLRSMFLALLAASVVTAESTVPCGAGGQPLCVGAQLAERDVECDFGFVGGDDGLCVPYTHDIVASAPGDAPLGPCGMGGEPVCAGAQLAGRKYECDMGYVGEGGMCVAWKAAGEPAGEPSMALELDTKPVVEATPEDESPAPAGPLPAGGSEEGCKSALEVVSGEEDLTTLAAAVEAAGLPDTLANKEAAFTILAPTDSAFGIIPQDDLDELLANKEALTEILGLHVILGAVKAEDLVDGAELETLAGMQLTVSVIDATVTFTAPAMGVAASVTEADVVVCSIVVHKIDSVLVPGVPEIVDAMPPAASPTMPPAPSPAAPPPPAVLVEEEEAPMPDAPAPMPDVVEATPEDESPTPAAPLPAAVPELNSDENPLRPLIPAYIWHDKYDAGLQETWQTLIEAVASSGFGPDDVFIIMNPNSGFISEVDLDSQEAFKDLAVRVKAVSKVVAYINLCNKAPHFANCADDNGALQGARPATETLGLVADWIAAFGEENIDGFFLDDTPMDGANKDNVMEVVEGIGAMNEKFKVFTNPGAKATDAELLGVVDTSVSLEGSSPDGREKPDTGFAREKYAMILHTVEASVWQQYMQTAMTDGYGYFYATSGDYQVLPTYLNSMLQSMSSLGDTEAQ